MVKGLKITKATLVISILLISILASISFSASAQEEEKDSKLVAFNSYVKVNFDRTSLQKPLSIDEVVSVPMDVTYYTSVPAGPLYTLMPTMLRNALLYGSPMAPQQQIKLSIVEKPDWADIHVAKPTLLVPFPEPGKEQEVSTNLAISPYREAPARPYSITVRAEAQSKGLINGITQDYTLTFTPSYIPQVEVYVNKPVREVSPRQTVNFDVRIENKANKHTIAKLDYEAPDDWAPALSQKEIEIPPASSEEVTFSVIAPYGFGWHDATESMSIKCTPYPSPMPTENLGTYQNASVESDIVMTNYGFSISGIEPILMILVIAVVIIAILWAYLKKQNIIK